MYPVSNAYKEAMHSRVQSFRVTGTVGSAAFNDENILEGSLSITNQCSGNENIEIGQVYIGELNCTFLNLSIDRNSWYGKEITINFGQRLADKTYEDIPLGVFTISEAEYTTSGVAVKAYDVMSKLDKTCGELVAGATPYILARKVCQKCGVTLENTEADFSNFANSNVVFSAYAENDISTYRDVLAWIAQLCGCFATASRTGGIIFKNYNSPPVDTIDDEHRFTGCSFSDYSTRYTGMSVVNLADSTTSYYDIKPDDALTYNLGSNPYLQIAISHSLTTMRRNVLNALAEINFTPFKAKCIGNPAYDLGDVLVFTDGIADGTKKSCLTKYVWQYGKDYEMTGAGKNPALATVYSKSDKNISGLISQTSGNKLLQYVVLRNREEIRIGNNSIKEIISAQYLSSQGSHIRINFEILLTAISDVEVRAIYFDDGEEITDRNPTETWRAGKHILTLQYDITHANAAAHSFDLWLEVTGGEIVIAPNDAYEVITSTGIFSDNVWEGTVRGDDNNLYVIIDGTAHKIPESITVGRYPNKTVYMADEPLDFTGIIIYAVYGDGTKEDITAQCTFNPIAGTPYGGEDDNYIEVYYSVWDLEYSTGFDLTYNGIIRIEMAQLPYKLNYRYGELIDYTGAIVVAVYQDETKIDVTQYCRFIPEGGIIFDYEALKAKTGLKTLEITSPTHTRFAEGDRLDYSGCEIWAYYADGSYQNVTHEVVFTPAEGTVVNSSTKDRVAVKYVNENGEAVSNGFSISIVKLRSIKVTPPTNTVFRAGQVLKYDGATVIATYTDGSTRDVTESAVFDPSEGSSAATSLAAVIVKYTDAAGNSKNGFFPVEIITLVSLKATKPRKYEYRYGERVSYTGAVITAVYSDGSTLDVSNNAEYSLAEGSTITRSISPNIIVSYTNENNETVSTSFELTIVRLASLQIATKPNRTIYNVDDMLDLTGLSVRAIYSDSSMDIVTNDCTFLPSTDTPLTKQNTEVVVQYSNSYSELAVTSFPISVGLHVLSELTITPPTKQIYRYGEIIDYTGLQVNAEYQDGTSEDVTEYITISPADGSVFTSTQDVTAIVSYDSITADFTLAYKIVNSLTAAFLPVKTSYVIGEKTNYTGCLMRATYQDGSIENVTSLCTFSPPENTSLAELGDTTVSVTYAQKTTSFTIAVNPISADRLEVSDTWSGIHQVGGVWDFSDVTVEVIYNDGTRTDVTSECTFLPSAGDIIEEDGDIPITVTYDNISATFTRAAVGSSEFLPYVTYAKSDIDATISISGFNFDRITRDNPSDIVVYSKIQLDGKIYDIIIT